MQFNDTTNKSGIIQRIEFTTGLPDGAISGDSTQLAYFTSLVNEVYYDVVTERMRAQDTWDFDDTNWTDYAVATTPLVAGQRDYSLQTDPNMFKIKRIDVSYDGSTYYRANATDSGRFEFGIGNDSDVDSQFSKTEPAYDVKADYIWLYPRAEAADVTAGGKIRAEYTRVLDVFTTADTSQEPGIDPMWHDLIALGAAMKYAAMRNHENTKSLKVLYDERMAAMREYYARKQDDMDTALIAADRDDG